MTAAHGRAAGAVSSRDGSGGPQWMSRAAVRDVVRGEDRRFLILAAAPGPDAGFVRVLAGMASLLREDVLVVLDASRGAAAGQLLAAASAEGVPVACGWQDVQPGRAGYASAVLAVTHAPAAGGPAPGTAWAGLPVPLIVRSGPGAAPRAAGAARQAASRGRDCMIAVPADAREITSAYSGLAATGMPRRVIAVTQRGTRPGRLPSEEAVAGIVATGAPGIDGVMTSPPGIDAAVSAIACLAEAARARRGR